MIKAHKNFTNFIEFDKELNNKAYILDNAQVIYKSLYQDIIFLDDHLFQIILQDKKWNVNQVMPYSKSFIESLKSSVYSLNEEQNIQQLVLAFKLSKLKSNVVFQENILSILNLCEGPLLATLSGSLNEKELGQYLRYVYYHNVLYGGKNLNFIGYCEAYLRNISDEISSNISSNILQVIQAAIYLSRRYNNEILYKKSIKILYLWLKNFEVNLGQSLFTEAFVMKHSSIDATYLRIYLVLCWIGLSLVERDVRFFNSALKLLGYMSRLPLQSMKIDFLCYLGLLSSLNILQSISSKEKIYEAVYSSLNSFPSHLLEPAENTKVVLLVAQTSSTFPLLWEQLKKSSIIPSGLIIIKKHEKKTLTAYSQPWYPGWPFSKKTVFSHFDFCGIKGVPLYFIDDVNSFACRNILKTLNPSLVILVSTEIVSKLTLKSIKGMFINSHNGILPNYRGMDAVAWAVFHQGPVGCSVHIVDKGIDTGAVLLIKKLDCKNIFHLKNHIKETQANLLIMTLQHFIKKKKLNSVHVQIPSQGRQYFRMHPELRKICNQMIKEA